MDTDMTWHGTIVINVVIRKNKLILELYVIKVHIHTITNSLDN